MLLSGQLIEERFIPDATIYGGDLLQQQIEALINDHEDIIENSGEQPQFTVASSPTIVKKRSMIAAVYHKLSFLHPLFGSWPSLFNCSFRLMIRFFK